MTNMVKRVFLERAPVWVACLLRTCSPSSSAVVACLVAWAAVLHKDHGRYVLAAVHARLPA